VSSADTPIFYPRYLAFVHVFLLVALARLVVVVHQTVVRSCLSFILLLSFSCIDYECYSRAPSYDACGIREASQYVALRRQGDQPVIVCSPYFYLPISYELRDTARCCLLDPGRPLRQYEGAAALSKGDVMTALMTTDRPGGRLWLIGGGGGADASALSAVGWREVRSRQFLVDSAVVGPITVVEYAMGQTN